MKRMDIGKRGEQLAMQYLQQKGLQILESNWRCRSGEIDVIALDQEELVFVEVRTRTSGRQRFGSAEESVDYRKQTQVRRVASVYLSLKNQQDHAVRFDVITIKLIPQHSDFEYEINHIPYAF